MQQLYNDITTGALRRKRGAGDIDFSDDEDLEEERRRKKREAFRREQNRNRALIEGNDAIAALTKDKKKEAFFRTLAKVEDEVNFGLGLIGEPEEGPRPQPPEDADGEVEDEMQEDEEYRDDFVVDDHAAASPDPLKRKLESTENDENRPPPNARRTTGNSIIRHGLNKTQMVKESLSFLLEEPVLVPASQYSDDELDIEANDEDSQTATEADSQRPVPILDRLSLSRQNSMAENEKETVNRRSSNAPTFRKPTLLRQATSNLSNVSSINRGGITPATEGVRRGGSKKSNIHYQAREAERKKIMQEAEKKRKAGVRKKVDGTGGRSVLAALGTGGFD